MAVSASCNSIRRTTVVMLDRYAWMSNNLIGSLISPSNHADNRHLCANRLDRACCPLGCLLQNYSQYPDESSHTSAICPSVSACAENAYSGISKGFLLCGSVAFDNILLCIPVRL